MKETRKLCRLSGERKSAMVRHNTQEETNRLFKIVMSSLTEVIGIVEEVRESTIILSFPRQSARFVVPIRNDELLKWSNHIKVGSHVAILFLDDGTIWARGVK
jgi:hypothetical protein